MPSTSTTQKQRRKSTAEKLAEHFSDDVAHVREYSYQPGRYTSPVYSLGDDLWAAGERPPKYKGPGADAEQQEKWKLVKSSFDPNVKLWCTDRHTHS